MKIISILQPWATLVVLGYKKIETRSWNTKYRGDLGVHASEKFTKEQERLAFEFSRLLKDSRVYHCHRGAIIGQTKLVSTTSFDPVRPMIYQNMSCYIGGHNYDFSEQEQLFGDYSAGRYGWLLKDAKSFDEPILAKGKLGIWEYNMQISDVH